MSETNGTQRQHRQPARSRAVQTVAAAIIALGTLIGVNVLSGSTAVLAEAGCEADGRIDSVEEEMLQLINDYRAANGVASLVLSDSLNRAAAWKSQDMANADYFAHDDITIDRSWRQRFIDCGYDYNARRGENIAAGNEAAQATFDQWRNSPGHNAAMLNEQFAAIGIARVHGPGTYGWYWTTDFGGFDDGYTSATPPDGDADTDGDGCADAREVGDDPARGGRRDPNNPWDYFNPSGDGQIRVNDIIAVVGQFGIDDGEAGYTASTDRTLRGPNDWNLGPPDGQQRVDDILHVIAQFGHDCP